MAPHRRFGQRLHNVYFRDINCVDPARRAVATPYLCTVPDGFLETWRHNTAIKEAAIGTTGVHAPGIQALSHQKVAAKLLTPRV